jgi:hypothetical protein
VLDFLNGTKIQYLRYEKPPCQHYLLFYKLVATCGAAFVLPMASIIPKILPTSEPRKDLNDHKKCNL